MADSLLEHIGDLPQVTDQKDSDLFEIEGTDGAANPTSNRETRAQLKSSMAAAGAVPDMAEARIAAAVGARDFEPAHAYKKNQLLFNSGGLYRAKYAFTSGGAFDPSDWEMVALNEWGKIGGALEDQEDLAAALGARLNKSAAHANGSTEISNGGAGSGFSAATTQGDTGTVFALETNTEAGNPVIGGMAGRTAASTTTGSRRLLFVTDQGGNIRVHLRKDKPAPAQASDLSEGDAVPNKGEIQAIVNGIMAALSQGLKTPGVIGKESDLPDASDAENGTYYVVQELDVTAPGQQGRAWKNDALAGDAWQVVIDNVFAPDEAWIGLDQAGALTIAASAQALINGALQGGQVEQALPETDDQADEGKLISRRAAFGLLPKQQDPAEAGKAMIIGPGGGLAPGVSGKVDSIDGVEPDSSKNVELTLEMTKAEHDALEDPPGSGLYPSLAGKAVTLADVYPTNARIIPVPEDYSTNEKPVLVNDHGTIRQKVDLDGSPIWCKTFTGTITQSANSRNLVYPITGVKRILKYDGWWDSNREGTSTTFRFLTIGGVINLSDTPSWSALAIDEGLEVGLYTLSDTERIDSPYQLYLEYTKV
jgi:hypothetical protein